MIARASDGNTRGDPGPSAGAAAAGAMAAIDAVLLATFEHRMLGDNAAEIEDAHEIGQLLDLDHPPGAIGHTVIVAANGDEAVMADTTFELEHGVEAVFGQGLQLGLLGGERLGDDALGGAMDAGVGHTCRASRSAGH